MLLYQLHYTETTKLTFVSSCSAVLWNEYVFPDRNADPWTCPVFKGCPWHYNAVVERSRGLLREAWRYEQECVYPRRVCNYLTCRWRVEVQGRKKRSTREKERERVDGWRRSGGASLSLSVPRNHSDGHPASERTGLVSCDDFFNAKSTF